MEQVAHRIASGLKDPDDPTFCTACVFCVRGHVQSGSAKALRTLRANHDFFSGIMHFLTVERDDESSAVVAAKLKTIMLSCPHSRLDAEHRSAVNGLGPSERLLYCIIICFFDCIHMCLYSSPRMMQVQSFSRHGLWPTGEHDILPRGPGPSCPVLLKWVSRIQDAQVCSAFGAIFLACPDLLPELLADAHRVPFLTAICAHLDSCVRELARFPERAADYDSQSPSGRFEHLSILLQILSVGATGAGKFAQLVRGMEERLAAAVLRAADVVVDADVKRRLDSFAVSLYEARGIAPAAMPARMRQQMLERQKRQGNSYAMLHMVLADHAERRVCGAPGCGRREHQTGNRLLACSVCKVLKYCSRECQKQHWSRGFRPHKATCSRMKELLSVADLKLGEEEFSTRCRAANVTFEDLARIYDALSSDPAANDVEKSVQRIANGFRDWDCMQASDPADLVSGFSRIKIGPS